MKDPNTLPHRFALALLAATLLLIGGGVDL